MSGHILTSLLAALLMPPLMADITPNDVVGASDSDRIENAIAQAVATTSRTVVIPGRNDRDGGNVWLIDRAILVPSDFTLVVSNACVRLAPGVKDNIIRNAGTTCDPLAGNTNIVIRGIGSATLSGGTGASHFTPAGDKSGWRTIGILLCGTERFTIENLTLENTQAWAISMENGCAHGTVRNIHFNLSNSIPNQDGVDVRKGCHDITIENLTGTTGDDSVAITGLRSTTDRTVAPTNGMQIGNRFPIASDDIYDIRIRNVRTTCSGGHGLIRLLNQDGIRLHDVSVSDVVEPSGGTRSARGIVIGDTNYSTIRLNQLGETYNIFVTNLQTYARTAVDIKGSLSNAVFCGVAPLATDTRLVAVGSLPTQNVVFCDLPYAPTATRFTDAVFEIDVTEGACDRVEVGGDLLLEGACTVEILAEPETLARRRERRHVFCVWNGVLQGRFEPRTNVRGWRVRTDASRREAALVYVREGLELIFR